MDRYGIDLMKTREMDLNDILHNRLKLLLIMAKNLIGGRAVGDYQWQAIEQNANHMAMECDSFIDYPASPAPDFDELCQHLKSLAMNLKSVAEKRRIGRDRKEIMLKDFNRITELLKINSLKRYFMS
ncbi:MAG: hypothetical protein P8X96_14275 [Desulfobacteraceae bacterium]